MEGGSEEHSEQFLSSPNSKAKYCKLFALIIFRADMLILHYILD